MPASQAAAVQQNAPHARPAARSKSLWPAQAVSLVKPSGQALWRGKQDGMPGREDGESTQDTRQHPV